ncbi:hypothetical protein RCL_jg11907.t1 [Rhizophagus clarus]|uniref:Uncharacterized protein n=1 Tax=Rhizophagus clarus TaxID=94130 RepID=A0A8H3QLU0_9GLOM|nr:hypothetical protein RCL_jg11907.t1 [Rhizophagus clarus]
MIRPPNNESEIIDNSPLLTILKAKMERCSSTNNVTTDAEFKLVETLLQETNIKGYNDYFVWRDLIDMSTSRRKFFRNKDYEAIQVIVACIQTTSRLWVLKIEDMNGGLYFDMAPKLDLAKYEVNLIELGGERVKLINLIDWAVTKGLILYHNINFLLYLLNNPVPNTKFFNLFIRFLAKPAVEINPEIMNPIL